MQMWGIHGIVRASCIFMGCLECRSGPTPYSPVIQADASISQMVNCDRRLCAQGQRPLGKDF